MFQVRSCVMVVGGGFASYPTGAVHSGRLSCRSFVAAAIAVLSGSSGKQADDALFQRSFNGIGIGQAIKRPVAADGPDCNVRRSWVRCYRRGEIGTSSSRPGRTWRTASTISVVCSLTNGHRLESRTTIPMLVCWRFCWCLMFWSAVTRTSYLFSSARLMSAPLAKPAQPCSSAVST